MNSHTCPLCSTPAPWLAQQRLLDRHDVDYFQCPVCDLLFTEQPHWLGEAYAEAISRLDTGAIARNQFSARLTLIIAFIARLERNANALDFGAGHGVFVRMMRDLGFDFRWYDKHAANLYALGFEGDPRASHELVTAFEVLEHLADVRGDLELLFGSAPAYVLVGTLLHDGHRPGWWYYLLDSGQHVVFYSRRTMAHIADRYGYEALVGAEHTLFVRRDRSAPLRNALLRRVVERASTAVLASSLLPRGVVERLAGFASRVQTDYRSFVSGREE
ncbi:MAG: class I SAM-dependent methyltransferase [Polyangia bacterium]